MISFGVVCLGGLGLCLMFITFCVVLLRLWFFGGAVFVDLGHVDVVCFCCACLDLMIVFMAYLLFIWIVIVSGCYLALMFCLLLVYVCGLVLVVSLLW